MVCCRKISRALAFVGLFALAVAMVSNSALAASLCSRVMMPEISAADISATVTSLGEMRLKLDSLQVEGFSKAEITLLKELYPVKLAELKRALNDRYSENEIHKMIVTEISKLQKNESKETRKDRENRAKEKNKLPRFSKKKHLEFKEPVASEFFEYFSNAGFVLFQNKERNAVMKKNLSSGEETLLFTMRNTARATIVPQLMPDGKHLLIHNMLGELWMVDVRTGKETSMRKLDLYYNIRLSPDGSKIFGSDQFTILIYDIATQTQKKIPHQQGSWTPAPLTSDSIIVSPVRGVYSVLNPTTGAIPVVNTHAVYNRLTKFTDDGSIFALFNREQLEVFNVSTPEVSLGEFKSDFFRKLGDFIKIPGHEFYIAKNEDNGLATFGLISQHNPTRFIFEFHEYSVVGGPRELRFKFSPDMKSTAVLIHHLLNLNPRGSICGKEIEARLTPQLFSN